MNSLFFQIDEIDEDSARYPGEDAALAAERKRLKNGEALIRLSHECYDLLSSTITENLAVVRKNCEQLKSLDPGMEKLAEELSGYSFMAEDYSSRFQDYCEQLQSEPSRLEEVAERLNQLQSLKRKYGETLEHVLAYLGEAETELERMENLDREIAGQRARTERLEKEVLTAALQLSDARRETARSMERAMEAELGSLAFDRAGLEVRFCANGVTSRDLHPTGFDRVEFFFARKPR